MVILKTSTCGLSEPQDNYSDLARVIELILEGIIYAIEMYNTLAKKHHMKDLVTHEMYEDLLKDDVSDEEDEEDWESFLPTLEQSGSRQRIYGL
jgi:bacterioferritin